jgi:diguanylate cyclase (GGDEF)-like protein
LPIIKYLNKKIETHHFSLVPLDFYELHLSVKNAQLDFVITNPAFYILLEKRYGVSRIATLLNGGENGKHISKKFGSVIFTKTDSVIQSANDLEAQRFAAVNKVSFGGWILAYKELLNHKVNVSKLDIKFLQTHDAVVKAVGEGEVEAGAVRTDTLERMAEEGKIDINDFKILEAKEYMHFPYKVSTELYPEWPIAKLKNIDDRLANKVLATLIQYMPTKEQKIIDNIAGWTAPLDYTDVDNLLKELRIPPYDKVEIKFSDILNKYGIYIYFSTFLLLLFLFKLFYQSRINIHLKRYSETLHRAVERKTKKLRVANKKLEVLASTDSLTGISNRAHFMKLAEKYFKIAKRNTQSLEIISLDLDYFKSINDTYGHDVGDLVLQRFTRTVSSLLRESDIFGRIGGEEFCIVLQNTGTKGALAFARRICKAVEEMSISTNGISIKITVSAGMVSLKDEEELHELIKKSDIALYEAKETGRNKVVLYQE